MAARDLVAICNDLSGCGDKMLTCMVDAVLIKDEQARLKAALKCMVNYEQCKADAVKDVALEKVRKKIENLLQHF